MKRFFRITAMLEVPTGLGLMTAPSLVVRLLLGSPLEASAAAMLGRVAGVALLTLGVACWLARDDAHSRAARGLVTAMFLYNVAVAALLALSGVGFELRGIALWPAVLLHAVMAVWCVWCLLFAPKLT